MQIPPPAAATTTAKAQLFEGAMRLRYSVLLEKGLTMMEHTVQMAERAGEHSEWVVRATESKARLEQAVRDETAALDRLPYTREDLQRALAGSDACVSKEDPEKISGRLSSKYLNGRAVWPGTDCA